jgi:hypothetical protein
VSLAALVRCRCWEDGLVTEPPVPRELISVDDENCLHVALPTEDERYAEFVRWEQNACAHEDFTYAYEGIGSGATVSAFLDALYYAGEDHFPVLLAEIDAGPTSPEESARCLEELEFFRAHTDFGTATTLFDDESGAALRRRVPGMDWFIGANPWRIGLDEDGFFVRRLVDPPATAQEWGPGATRPSRSAAATARDEEVFRATLFSQEVVLEPVEGIDAWVRDAERLVMIRLVALDRPGEITVALDRPIESPDGQDYPRRLRVEDAPIPPETFATVVDSLTTVFRASVEIRQPVNWC